MTTMSEGFIMLRRARAALQQCFCGRAGRCRRPTPAAFVERVKAR